jgi:hypothetical protein
MVLTRNRSAYVPNPACYATLRRSLPLSEGNTPTLERHYEAIDERHRSAAAKQCDSLAVAAVTRIPISEVDV